MRLYFIIMIIVLVGCKSQKDLNSNPEIIAYRFPDKIENLLLKQIKEKPSNEYCLLIREDNNVKSIWLVKEYSYFHKITSYRALLGEHYYPISFPQFDRKYGVVENAEDLLKRKISNKDSDIFLTKISYPIYHEIYKIDIDSNNNIIFEGYIY